MKFLVVCRVEKCANAPKWLSELGELAKVEYSTYGDEPEHEAHFFRGGKWAGLHDFFMQNPKLLEIYEYFWFPDDDILTTGDNAAAFLRLCRLENFELAQPSLTPDSYFAYRELIGNPRFSFRNTNLVELMMPCMRADFLRRVLPLFEGKHAALGLDWMWQNLAQAPLEKIAVVDAYPMLHSRPRNQHLTAKMRGQDISIADERAAMFAEHSIQTMVPLVYSARLLSGRHVKNNFALTALLLLGHLTVAPKVTNGVWRRKHTFKLARNQLKRRCALKTLTHND